MTDKTDTTDKNPFEEAPSGSGANKVGFGTLRVHVTGVMLVSGEGYTLPGLVQGKSGEAWVFKGKKPAGESKQKHVVLVVERKAQDGHTYNAFTDFMYWENDKACKIALPALRQHFGQKLEGIWGKTAEVQYEEIHYTDKGKDGTEYDRMTFKVVKVFGTREEREAAEKAYFAALPSRGNGANLTPASEWAEFVPEMRKLFDNYFNAGDEQESALKKVIGKFDPKGTGGLTPSFLATLLELPL